MGRFSIAARASAIAVVQEMTAGAVQQVAQWAHSSIKEPVV
jgi:hypothetical protein